MIIARNKDTYGKKLGTIIVKILNRKKGNSIMKKANYYYIGIIAKL